MLNQCLQYNEVEKNKTPNWALGHFALPKSPQDMGSKTFCTTKTGPIYGLRHTLHCQTNPYNLIWALRYIAPPKKPLGMGITTLHCQKDRYMGMETLCTKNLYLGIGTNCSAKKLLIYWHEEEKSIYTLNVTYA